MDLGGYREMRAMIYRCYGDPSVLEMAEEPVPKLGKGEVLVRVVATTVCSGDLRL